MKQLIESFNILQTEVDHIPVDETSVNFLHFPKEGDIFSGYPVYSIL